MTIFQFVALSSISVEVSVSSLTGLNSFQVLTVRDNLVLQVSETTNFGLKHFDIDCTIPKVQLDLYPRSLEALFLFSSEFGSPPAPSRPPSASSAPSFKDVHPLERYFSLSVSWLVFVRVSTSDLLLSNWFRCLVGWLIDD